MPCVRGNTFPRELGTHIWNLNHVSRSYMTTYSKDAMRKIALKIYKDATSATTEDAKKLAKAWLLMLDGRLPQ